MKHNVVMIVEVVWTLLYMIPLLLKKLYDLWNPKPFKSLNGKTVLITGAAQGIGKGLASEFVALGCKVMCVDVNTEICEQTVKELGKNARAFTCDISDPEAVAALAAKTGPVDILINNAGLISFAPFLEMDQQLISRTFDVNVKAHFWLLREYLPTMLKKNEGHVVAIASAGGIIAPANLSVYCSSKFAVVGLMESLTEELRHAGSNVKATCVCPNFVRTMKVFDTSLKSRFPAMDVPYAVREIMKGIREEQPIFTVPRFLMSPLRHLRIFPMEIQYKLKDVLYIRLEGSGRN